MKNRSFEIVARHKESAVLVGIHLLTMAWLVTISLRGIQDTTENYLHAIPLDIALIFYGWVLIRRDYKKNHIGLSVRFLAFGLLSWGIGSIIYLYYNIVLSVPVPYPSWAELGYGTCYIWWIIGLWYLICSFNLRGQASTLLRKIILFIVPFGLVISSYYLFIMVAKRGAVLLPSWSSKLFFDIAYPFGDTLILLLLAFIFFSLVFKRIDHKYFTPLVILMSGFMLNYSADFFFSYNTNNELYFLTNWLDALFGTALTTIGVGTIELSKRLFGTKKIGLRTIVEEYGK